MGANKTKPREVLFIWVINLKSKVFIYIRKVLFLFLCGALSFSYGYGQELPLLPDTIKPLLSDSNLIDELITVGYATGNRSTLSGSVNRVNEGGMNEGLISTPLDALRGRVSGVSIPVGGNSAAALAAVRVRGTTSLTGGNDPLVGFLPILICLARSIRRISRTSRS